MSREESRRMVSDVGAGEATGSSRRSLPAYRVPAPFSIGARTAFPHSVQLPS